MKKFLFLAAAAVMAVGCASTETASQTSDVSLRKDAAKYQIIDQEFDNVLAPETDYDTVLPYEEQISNSSYLQSVKGSTKPAKKVKADVDDQEPVPPSADNSTAADNK